jgi:hypothetical protein
LQRLGQLPLRFRKQLLEPWILHQLVSLQQCRYDDQQDAAIREARSMTFLPRSLRAEVGTETAHVTVQRASGAAAALFDRLAATFERADLKRSVRVRDYTGATFAP